MKLTARHYIYGFLGIGLIAGMSGVSNQKQALEQAVSQSKQAEPVVQVQAPPKVVEKPIAVTARQLFAEYDNNELAADNKYRGKALDVTGVIVGVERGLMDGVEVVLQGRNMFETVRAPIIEEIEADAATWSKGDTVELRCIGAGEALGMPLLKDCF